MEKINGLNELEKEYQIMLDIYETAKKCIQTIKDSGYPLMLAMLEEQIKD